MDSCPFIVAGNISSYAVMMLSQFSSIVWVFELKDRTQAVKWQIAATSSFVCSKNEAFWYLSPFNNEELFRTSLPEGAYRYEETSLFSCFWLQQRSNAFPRSCACVISGAVVSPLETLLCFFYFFARLFNPMHNYKRQFPVFSKVTENWWALTSYSVSHYTDCFFLHESDLR